MLRATRRRFRAPAWLVLAIIVGLPAMAEAQLFPNRPIKRQRESCAAESPFNAHVRKDYYGYYPTCWSKFPEGWACPCPNPELPNAAAEFAKRPRDPIDAKPLGDGPDLDGRLRGNDAAPATDPNLPVLPGGPGRGPFEIDQPPGSPLPRVPPTGPGGGGGVAPSGRIPQTSMLDELPSITAPSTLDDIARPAGAMAMAPNATLASNVGQARPDVGPLPSAPMPAASTPGDTSTVLSGPSPAGYPMTDTVPAQAPKRRSILGGIFGQGNKRIR